MAFARPTSRPRPRPRTRRLAPVALLALAGIASLGLWLARAEPAAAHGRSHSYSSFTLDATGALVSLRMPLVELSRLGPGALPPGTLVGAPVEPGAEGGAAADGSVPDPTADRFARELVLSAADVPCAPRLPARRLPDATGWVRYAWRVDCPTQAGALAIRSRVLLDVAPSHLHFARVRFGGAPEEVRERVLTEASPVFMLRTATREVATGEDEEAAEGSSRFADYLALGIRHILSGWDHLAFLLGLILLAERPGAMARLVTGFTLAHSLTLALAVAGLVHPRAAAVEAVIAFSVALVALEKGWLVAGRPRAIPLVTLMGLGLLTLASAAGASALPVVSLLGLMLFTPCYFALAARERHDGLRIALTFAFGLVHGFGFAGVLAEMALPAERLVPALLGFNLGVELGQLGVVLLAWPVLALARRTLAPAWQRGARDLVTAGLCGLGSFWLLERAVSF